MEKVRKWITIIVAIVVAIYYAIGHQCAWWEWIVAILTSILCFTWIEDKFRKTWSFALGMVAGLFLVEAVGIPISMFFAEALIFILSVALKVVVWGFDMGLTEGIIIALLVWAILGGLFS